MRVESSRTSMWAGQSGQLWCQQTITSQPVIGTRELSFVARSFPQRRAQRGEEVAVISCTRAGGG